MIVITYIIDMNSPLHKELKMKVSFDSLETEVFLNLSRTYSVLAAGAEKCLKGAGLTGVQYNVLRILRGAGADGIPSLEIGKRMVTRVPDVTRLVDRLLKQGLVERRRCNEDRRVVFAMITAKGKVLLKKLDQPVSTQNKDRFKHMSKKKLKLLNELLVEARSGN